MGFFKAEFGHGEAARRIVAGIEQAGIPFSTITMRAPHHRERHAFDERSSAEVYGTNVVCLNPEHILEFAEAGGRDLLASRYTIGAWCWEGSRFPPSLHGALQARRRDLGRERVRRRVDLRGNGQAGAPVPDARRGARPAEPLAEGSRPSGRPLRLSLRLRLLQHARAEEPARPDRSVQARLSAGLGPNPRPEEHQRRQEARGARARAGGCRHAPRHPRRRRVRRGGARPGVDGSLRLLRLAPPQRGLRPHDRRRDGVRKARGSDPVLGQLDLHGRRQQLPGRCRPRDGAAGHPELPGGKRVGRPESGRGGGA